MEEEEKEEKKEEAEERRSEAEERRRGGSDAPIANSQPQCVFLQKIMREDLGPDTNR
jgi:hypothetical protein